jgi:hypothetical protein
MKLKDIAEMVPRWSTPLGTMDSNAPVADGVLVGLSLWGTSIIGLAGNAPMEDISTRSERQGWCTTTSLSSTT